jgi:predicted nucleic acid-binding protein
MKRLVIDASVAVKWFLPDASDEGNSRKALDLLRQLDADDATFAQPAHWKAEIASVLARRVPTIASACLDDLCVLEGITIIDTPVVYRRAIDLAQKLDHHLFDTLYHALALELAAHFITADRRYYDKAAHLGNITLLAQFAS